MKSFFISITEGLEVKEGNESNANTMKDMLDVSNSHPSIEIIRKTVKTYEKFSFQPVPEDLVCEIILNLDGSKATPVVDIPVYMLKSTVGIHLLFITKIMIFSFESGCCPDEQKLAELSPIFKNNDKPNKENCQYFLSCVKGL